MSTSKKKKIFISCRIPENLIDSMEYLVEKHPNISKNFIIEVALNYFFSKNDDVQRNEITRYLLGVQTPHK